MDRAIATHNPIDIESEIAIQVLNHRRKIGPLVLTSELYYGNPLAEYRPVVYEGMKLTSDRASF